MPPRTDTHRLLRELAALWLRGQRCFELGFEVFLYPENAEKCRFTTGRRKWRRYYADTVGTSRLYPSSEQIEAHRILGLPEPQRFLLWCAEAKSSRSDFKNGFVSWGCNRHYVVTPPSLIAPKELPKHVGLLEIDLVNYRVSRWSQGTIQIHGPRVVKRPVTQKLSQELLEVNMRHVEEAGTKSLLSVLLNKYHSGKAV